MSNYWSSEVLLGTSLGRRMKAERVTYHDKALRIAFSASVWNRTGSDMQLSLTQQDYIHEPEQLRVALLAAVGGTPVDVVVVDFSGNTTSPVREPVLIQLADAMRNLCASRVCHTFLLLFSVTPSADCASSDVVRRFAEREETKDLSVICLGGDGRALRINEAGVMDDTPLGVAFAPLFRECNTRPDKMLERKCIERLGHFVYSTENPDRSSCRWFSYWLMEDCVEDLTELFEQWWMHCGLEIGGVIYDCPNNPCLRDAACTIAMRRGAVYERFQSVIEDDVIIEKFKQKGPSVLVLDYVQNGTRLRKLVASLRGRGIALANKVVCGVNKVNVESGRTELHGFSVHGFISRPPHSEVVGCVQCSLGIPHDSDEHETMFRIRSFDMFHMIREAGWAPEPKKEVPRNATAYEIQPNFSGILDKHCRWLAYKMFRLMNTISLPDDLVLIHPEEGDSSRLATCIRQLSRGRRTMPVLPVPRVDGIDDVLEGKREWKTILSDEANAGRSWAIDLQRTRAGGALIVDIYYGSGATSNALVRLCEHLDWPVCAVIVFIDFAPAVDDGRRGIPPRYSLYDWQAPRQ